MPETLVLSAPELCADQRIASPPPPIEPLLSKSNVAQITGASIRTVESWIDSGLLRVTRPGGRLVKVDPADLRDFIQRAKAA